MLMRASRGEPEIDTYGSDEEMWRKIHDPVGHQRMFITRLCIAQGYTDLLSTDHVERTVAKFARKYNGPCQCKACTGVLLRLRRFMFEWGYFGPKEISEQIDDRFCLG